jgi:1,4-alpha-glucan branching enzyme
MALIIDWVPNSTGWDHAWITDHPEYYTKDKEGNIAFSLNDKLEKLDWTDVADLDFGNMKLQEAMIEEMNYWITVEGIDGFRCDMASGVPVSFWEKALPKLRAEKEIIMLAEAELLILMKDDLFDISYADNRYHLFNAIAKEKKGSKDFTVHMEESYKKWEADDILMNFMTNHSENAWSGSVKERMGEARQALLALSYCAPGIPLIYSGQEYDLNRKLKFFEKDEIPKTKGETWPLLTKLGWIKNNTPALHGGKTPASYEVLPTSHEDHILAFRRKKGESEVIYIANLTSKPIKFGMALNGLYNDVMYNEEISFKNVNELEFAPWEYLILRK